MRNPRFIPGLRIGRIASFCLLLSLLLVVTGCPPKPAPVDPGPGAITGNQQGASTNATTSPDKVLIGHRLTMLLLDVPDPPPPIELQVREDGTLSLPRINKSIPAAGKMVGDLETEIQSLYVPSFYTRCTVVLKMEERYYAVKGQVNHPGQLLYTGGITVLKAIAAAGDFTDFAKRTNVQITRSDGRILKVNCNKALKDPRLDIEVYPNDIIDVPRRIIW